jgi:hypothetical protein
MDDDLHFPRSSLRQKFMRHYDRYGHDSKWEAFFLFFPVLFSSFLVRSEQNGGASYRHGCVIAHSFYIEDDLMGGCVQAIDDNATRHT